MKEISTSNICNDDCSESRYFQPMTTIATRIANARKELNLNQSELARLLSVTPQAVQSWESGKARPKGARLENLAKALGKSVQWLMVGEIPGRSAEMSESITTAALEVRQRIRNTSATEEIFRERTRSVANYLIMEEQLENLERQVIESFKDEMAKAAWFDKIKNPQLLSALFWITKGAAEEVLTKEEIMVINTVADRLRSREIENQES
ncbi:helix-turn-helix transcriptional regulator [Pseudomonas kielensis]|uniref:helix-turn-helix domain-containing protein n=1 Tax=Pseudomonas kielensis TaxID=2762577 RepID=UPI00265E9E5F|nr:helix-turn-helix transcriptional regulator [Pseudomonas kielensis]WKL53105.1 helix-turn-helix transcriptional regulator [Pseudomonas kielensis]